MFQETMERIPEQCPSAGDVGVFGRTEEKSNAKRHHLMQAAQNGDKFKIKTSKPQLFGLVFYAN